MLFKEEFEQRFIEIFGKEYLEKFSGNDSCEVCLEQLNSGKVIMMGTIDGHPFFTFINSAKELSESLVAAGGLTKQKYGTKKSRRNSI